MRPGIIMALIASSVLVGGASWYRYAHVSYQAPMLTVEEKAEHDTANDQFLKSFLSAASSTSLTPAPEKLTTTDLMSRQLMIDYLNLEGNGQATPANIQALGDQYAATLPSLAPAPQVTAAEIRVVPDSQASFVAYSNGLRDIYVAYERTLGENKIIPTGGNNVGKKEYDFMKNAGLKYQKQAQALEKLPVPTSLGEAHLRLINANLANASAFTAIAGGDTDPAVSMAGLAKMNRSLSDEEMALNEIEGIMQQKPSGL